MKNKKWGVFLAVLLAFSLSACKPSEPNPADGVTGSGSIPETPVQTAETEVVFPAYQEGREEYNAEIYDTAPFRAVLQLPEGWEVRLPDLKDRKQTPDNMFTPVDLYRGETFAGRIGFNQILCDVMEEVPDEEYYKVAYAVLRLGSVEYWDPYTPVKKTENGENAIVVVNYKDPDEKWASHSAAEIPVLTTWGALAYDKQLGVSVALRFERGIYEEEAREIAESIRLEPQESAN